MHPRAIQSLHSNRQHLVRIFRDTHNLFYLDIIPLVALRPRFKTDNRPYSLSLFHTHPQYGSRTRENVVTLIVILKKYNKPPRHLRKEQQPQEQVH